MFPGAIKSEHWEEIGEIISYLCEYLQNLGTVFFKEQLTFSNCFQIFKWIARESFLHRVPVVHKQTAIGVQINTLQTKGVEITLIQCCFNVTMLKQR